MHHVTAPCPHFTPAVQHSHPFDAVRRSALDILVQFAEFLADALYIIHELRELQCQLQVAAVANAVNGLAQDGAAGCDPVFFGFFHRVAALMERVREEVRQKASFRVLHSLNVGDQAQRGAIAHAAYHGIQPDGLELRHKGLGTDPMVSQEHHGFAAALMGDVHHLLGQLGHFPTLESLEVPELLAGHPVLVVVVTLVDDVLRPELVAHFLLKLVQDVGADGSRIAIPVHKFFPLEFIEDQGELMEERGIADDVYIRMLCNEFSQTLHGIFVGFRLTHIKRDLMLEIRPAVGGGIVHMHRVPDQIGQKADSILMERHSLYGDTAVSVAPLFRRHRQPGGTVHDLPPTGDVVVGVHLHQFRADAFHQRDGHGVAGGGVEARHNVALLHLVRVCFGPCVILARGIIGGIDLCIGVFQLLRKIRTIAVTDGIRAPLFQNLQRFGHHIQVSRNGNAPGLALIFHSFPLLSSILIGCVVNGQYCQQQCHAHKHDAKPCQLSGHFPACHHQCNGQHKQHDHQHDAQGRMRFPECFHVLSPYPFKPPTVMPCVSCFCTQMYKIRVGSITSTRPAYMVPYCAALC